MQAYTLADITPAGSKTPLTTNASLYAVAVIFSAPSANSGGIRVGDVNTGSGQGSVVNPGQSIEFPRGAFDQQGYPLASIYVYGTSTDKITITYVQ